MQNRGKFAISACKDWHFDLSKQIQRKKIRPFFQSILNIKELGLHYFSLDYFLYPSSEANTFFYMRAHKVYHVCFFVTPLTDSHRLDRHH
jgi:hypothetical protein